MKQSKKITGKKYIESKKQREKIGRKLVENFKEKRLENVENRQKRGKEVQVYNTYFKKNL